MYLNYMNLFRFITLILLCTVFYSCNKDSSKEQNSSKSGKQTEEVADTETESDTEMTPEEIFSSSLVQDIMGDEENADLQIYLEEQIYPLVSKSGKVTLDKISSSLYLLSYEEGGVMKNYLLQKFYDPVKDEFLFDKTETQLNAVKQFVK